MKVDINKKLSENNYAESDSNAESDSIEQREVQFNNGFVTALGLFYGHLFQFLESSQITGRDMRIYGAADHLFDMEIPEMLPDDLKSKINEFREKVMMLRMETISSEQGAELFEMCLSILKNIDRIYFAIEPTVYYR